MIAAIAAWARSARWHATALHLLEMLPPFGAGWLISVSAWGGFVVVCAFYWGVKKTETRVATERIAGVTLSASNLGLFPWDWWRVSPWLVIDFIVPVGASAGLAWWLSEVIG